MNKEQRDKLIERLRGVLKSKRVIPDGNDTPLGDSIVELSEKSYIDGFFAGINYSSFSLVEELQKVRCDEYPKCQDTLGSSPPCNDCELIDEIIKIVERMKYEGIQG